MFKKNYPKILNFQFPYNIHIISYLGKSAFISQNTVETNNYQFDFEHISINTN